MTTNKQKRSGARYPRSETVSVRLDPKVRYLAEIAARIQKRTLSSYVEWAIQHGFGSLEVERKQVGFEEHGTEGISLADVGDRLWDIDEPDRFAKLAMAYPSLLTFEEQRIWKHVQEAPAFWGPSGLGYPDEFNWKHLRASWPALMEYGAGTRSEREIAQERTTK